MAFSYLLSAVLCSFLSLDDRLCNTASCQRWFSQIFMHFQSRKLCVYIPSPLSRNPQHKTKTAPITASSIHRLLTFVNAAHKDGANGRFRGPAAGANATRILLIDSKSFRFTVYIQILNFYISTSVIIWMFVTEIMIPCGSFTWQLLSLGQRQREHRFKCSNHTGVIVRCTKSDHKVVIAHVKGLWMK